MIRFEHLTKSYPTPWGRKVVIDDLSLELPSGKALGLLGRNGAGKSTLMQIVAGTLPPDSGRVISDGTISWPIGLGGALHPDMTGAQNVRFIARIYGIDSDSLCAFVQDFAELGAHFQMPLRSYSSGMRSRLAFGASMGIPFDTYLVDEVTSVGDARFRAKSKAIFRERMKTSGAIMVSHNMKELQEFCDAGLVLENGRMYYFERLDAAIRLHKRLMEQ
ncbi:ATP-binding protein [Gemmobacter aquaticus]|uniref:ATP-binding protein n=1 Tax=Gemmobacter aquaticus TaxID=490185 RepID=A0A917YQU5_9RHOB|nr:ABC transporter ATP-binding protein [Gemmobacter aquaticus]GGO38969.1 ATP-binding protein [Gemmobacter aquaticus]